ncbi:serine/threonine-protein kinase [Kamptonema formosum]|uniref:serine/threonine-protein kinase n=1 Tax=Kamptonema formosum TaxID=331992 RepID=UPI00034C286D|nr:serine/threonine-protein kinase [Oscillatoria sp. PCC 10802]
MQNAKSKIGRRYCLNPDCPKPQNWEFDKVCQGCGAELLLGGRFRAIELIGNGRFSRTYWGAVESESLLGFCTIKQFWLPEIAPADFESASEGFRQKALRLEELGAHPHLPAVLAHFEGDGRLYLVLEYIEGRNLEKVLEEEGTFSEAQIWQVLEALLPVLKVLHDRQIIHGDIKPVNIIRRHQDSRLVLVDFGAAQLVSGTDLWGGATGSAEYVAPEQAKGNAVFASDLYSLGVSCANLLTGISPFQLFDAASDCWVWRDYLRNTGSAGILPVSARLGEILDKLLENAVFRRFQSAGEVMRAMNLPFVSRAPTPSSSWRCTGTLAGHSGLSAGVTSVAISPQGHLLATGSDDRTARLWDLDTGECLRIIAGHSNFVKSVAFSPDGRILATGSDDRTVKLWDVAGGGLLRTLAGHSHAVKSVAFSPEGQCLASGSWDKTVRLWDAGGGEEIATLRGHGLQVAAVAISPCGQRVASGSLDRTVRLWDLPSGGGAGRVLQGHLWPVLAAAFSPDGKILATGSEDNTVKLWDVKTGDVIRTLSGHSWSVAALAFSAGGEILVSGSWDKTVKLWRVATGEEVETLVGHTDSVCAVAAAGGKRVASGSRDKTVKLWERVG